MKNPITMWNESRWNTPLTSVCLVVALAAIALFIKGLRLHNFGVQPGPWYGEGPSPFQSPSFLTYLGTFRAKFTGGIALGAFLVGAVDAWFANREE